MTFGSEPIHPTKPKPTLLIVEDNLDVRAYLRDHLNDRYLIREAGNGREALEEAREAPPDLVLSDVMMPEMDGAELCRVLKTDEMLRDIPVVLLTARAGEQERIEGLHTGADDYIEKPFNIDELHARVANLLESRRQLREQYRREIVMAPTNVIMTSEAEAFYEKARATVEEHMSDGNFYANRFADEMHMSASTLTRKLKEATGLAPAAFIRRMRLERAAQLFAQDGGLTIQEVAREVGYRDAGHFSRMYREHFGAAPGE